MRRIDVQIGIGRLKGGDWWWLLAMALTIASVCWWLGCAANQQRAMSDEEIKQGSGQVATAVEARIDVQITGWQKTLNDSRQYNFDPVTLRWLVIGGVVIMPFVCYVLPKIGWRVTAATARYVAKRNGKIEDNP